MVVEPPLVVVASSRSRLPLAFSHAAARSGRRESLRLDPAGDVVSWEAATIDTARVRPMALRSDAGWTLEQRLGAIMGADASASRHHRDATPEAAARLVLDALDELGLSPAGAPGNRTAS